MPMALVRLIGDGGSVPVSSATSTRGWVARGQLAPSTSIAITSSLTTAVIAVVPAARRELLGDPPPHRVVATGEMPRVVGVQALDALARATDAAGRAVLGVLRQRGVALGGVSRVGRRQLVGVDGLLGRAHAAGSFQAADRLHGRWSDEPVARRHRRAVVEQCRVADHDRVADVVAHDDLERAGRLPPQQLTHAFKVGCRHGVGRVSAADARGAARRGAPRAPAGAA